jgi:protein-S-isoprenylcysteine O-methyltransferase Ste14
MTGMMTIKGLDQLRQHVPDLNNPLGILRYLLLSVVLLFLVTTLFNSIPLSWTYGQLVAEIFFGCLGFGLLYLFFRFKKEFKARFGSLAYSKAGRWFGFPGVTIIAVVIAHIRSLPGPGIPHFQGYIIVPAVGWVLIGVGTLLGLRTVLTFGVDNLTMLYVYFPEESRLVNHKIYTILRHPAYSALQLIAFGLALLNGNWFALACALIFAIGLWAWVHLVEESELIGRFGPTYLDYRQRVPAFWPRLRDLLGFFEFLLVGR